MPKIKMPRNSPGLDMTPMVDLAFLLVTFFMLTASVRVTEPVIVDTPSSISDKLLPENAMLITIDKDGKAFYNITNPQVRIKTLERMAKQYNVNFSDEQKKAFGGMTSFGIPLKALGEYINHVKDEQKSLKMTAQYHGVPLDSTNNQLRDWIQFGRIEAATQATEEKNKAKKLGRPFKYEPLRFAIKADGGATYMNVKQIIDVFKKLEIYRFNLITNLEQE